VVFAACAAIINAKDCKDCTTALKKPVCGTDGTTYASLCDLEKAECELITPIGFQCDGSCPCDPEELRRLDAETVSKLAKLRKEFQIEKHAFEKSSEDILDHLSNQAINVIAPKEDDDNALYYKENPELYGCLKAEKLQLPQRLIDWFHVLKTNEREAKNKELGIKKQPALKEMKFIDAKLKAMYAKLACADNEAKVEKEVCLPSVKWMFAHLDANKDGNLIASEFSEIEEINSEHCIKPFLKSCDRNNDAKVTLKEFCKCLCVTPPCTHALESVPTVLMGGEPRPLPGLFEPKCDEDGFFMPMQHNKNNGDYWCVNRNGAEIRGSREDTHIECEINTRVASEVERHMLIPLDMKKENQRK